MAKPESTPKTSNTTTQPPIIAPNAPINSEKANPLQERTSDSNPYYSKVSQLIPAPHGPKQERCQKFVWVEEGWANPSHIQLKPPHKGRATTLRISNPQCCHSTAGREMWMGIKLPHLLKYRGELGWWPSKSKSAMYPKYSGTKCTTTSDARFPAPTATKCPVLLVTNILCTRQIFKPNKTLQRVGEKIERLNDKYGLDCLSDSELDSESDEGEDYGYEHKYETLL